MRIKSLNSYGFGRLFAGLFVLLLAACQTMPDQPGFSPRQIAALEERGFQEQPDGSYLLGLSDRLLFDFDKSELREDTTQVLGDLASALTDIGVRGAEVVGHTDSLGAEQYNLELSLRRADAVGAALAQYGLVSSRIRTVGMGETDPLESNDTEAGRSQNRRVEVIVGPEDLLVP